MSTAFYLLACAWAALCALTLGLVGYSVYLELSHLRRAAPRKE